LYIVTFIDKYYSYVMQKCGCLHKLKFGYWKNKRFLTVILKVNRKQDLGMECLELRLLTIFKVLLKERN
jgi:hypothetical protein